MGLLPSFRFAYPGVRAARVALAAGAVVGLVVLGACADNAGKALTAPAGGPRDATIFGGGFANASHILACVEGSSPAGTYKFTNTGTNNGLDLDGNFDGADGGDGTWTTNVPDNTEYVVGVGACVTIFTRLTPDSDYPAFQDTWSGTTITATTIPATAVYDSTNCNLDLGTKLAIPDPCGVNNNPTKAYANFDHGSEIHFFFGEAPAQATPLFVIGDVEAHGIGTIVNFWGSQWWKNNFMSGLVSSGVASFKGFAEQADNFCGGNWSSRVGNSPPPPDVIPDDVAILVTTKVVKNGPNLGGSIKEILIVHSDGGYGPNPGHDGNGPVITVVCSL